MPLLTLYTMSAMFFHFLKTWFAFAAISGSSSCLVVSAPSHACSFMFSMYFFCSACHRRSFMAYIGLYEFI